MKKAYFIAIIIIIAAVGFWLLYLSDKSDEPKSTDFSVFYPVQNREHIEVGAAHPPFSSNPPSSGWHYGLTAKKRFYDEPVPDEYVIHNLEHGDIWITYRPDISQKIKEQLKQFGVSKVLISPRENNETDIALVAWERVDAFNLDGSELQDERINDFIKRYRNKGPEKLPLGSIENTFN